MPMLTDMDDYCGAGARLSPDKGLSLPPRRWAWQVKHDGAFCRLRTDAAGRISSMLMRSGRPFQTMDAADFIGLAIGLPNSIIYGELEAHTEAAVRARGTRGWPALHLFDASVMCTRDIAAQPYAERYAALHQWQAAVECDQPIIARRFWWTDRYGEFHDGVTGRYCRPVPRDLRRLPITELVRSKASGEALWQSHVIRGGGEGLVAVRLDAPLGARNAKRKIKNTDTISATVISTDGRASTLSYGGHTFVVSSVGKALRPGMVVDLAHDGWYESSVTPRFPRIVRVRDDLSPVAPVC